MKVIAQDNFDRDYVSETLIAGLGLSTEEAQNIAEPRLREP